MHPNSLPFTTSTPHSLPTHTLFSPFLPTPPPPSYLLPFTPTLLLSSSHSPPLPTSFSYSSCHLRFPLLDTSSFLPLPLSSPVRPHLLMLQLLESEIVAMNCSVRCVEQNIPYYRFSPQLNHVIAAGEMDNEKLLEMMWMTRIQTHQQGLADLITLFQLVAEASKKNRYRCSRSHDLDSVQQCVV